ncbi:MAG: S41 family peptidase [Bacteroidales bacterium]|nr:S41 family peptidase [Bacteroidales bacterium]
MLHRTDLYSGQEPAVPVEASTILTPGEMKKDIDFFFNTIVKVHVNIYAFVTKETMDERKNQLYKLCSKPMKAIDFNRYMCRLNDMFDGHTSVSFDYDQELNNYDGFFPLPVDIVGGEMYLLDGNGTKKGRILSINQVQSSDIYNKIININEINAASELRVSPRFSQSLYIQTDIQAPYSVVTENGTTVLEGVPMKDVKKMPSGFDRQTPVTFRMYPEKSIAIIDYNSCFFGLDEAMQNQLNTWFDRQFREIADKKIKTLFIDISRNGGGYTDNNDHLFKRIKHDDTIRLTYAVQKQYDPYVEDGKKELGYMRSDTFTNITLPNRTGFDGNIYLIQGYGSYSAAIDVAEWMKELDKAKNIGEQTGQATAVYIDMAGFKLPKSQIYFGCAYKYWKALPDGREDQGVLPDASVKLDYSKSKYELTDLLSFLHQIDPELSSGPEEFPKGTKLMVKNATASDHQPNENIDKALDGNFYTRYHSPWRKSVVYPVVLTFDFEEQPQIDYFIHYPRTDIINGLFGKVEIWASTKSSPELEKIATHDFHESNAPSCFQFPRSLEDPLTIELRVMSSASLDDDIKRVSCMEIEFYKKE